MSIQANRRRVTLGFALLALGAAPGCVRVVTPGEECDEGVAMEDAGLGEGQDPPGTGAACAAGGVEIDGSQAAWRGGTDAVDVEVHVFACYCCPACAQFEPELERVMARSDIASRTRFFIHHFPLRGFPYARELHLAAVAAERQGRFWDMHPRLFGLRNGKPGDFRDLAEELGLDMERYDEDVDDPAVASVVCGDLAQGEKAGVNGTPTVFVCGRKLSDAMSLESTLEARLGL
jgi:protein-disulfide isomerase